MMRTLKNKDTVVKNNFLRYLSLFIILFFNFNVFAQQKSVDTFFPEVDIHESNCPSEGYFFIASNELVSSNDSNYIAIIDNFGTPVFFKIMTDKVSNFKIQPNGYLTYCTGEPKKIFVLDSSYNNLDTITPVGYKLNDADFILTENNEIILLAYEDRFFDMSTIVTGGNSNALIKESVVQILDANEQEIFSWKSSDYFNILDVNVESPFVNLTSSEIDYISLSDIEIDSDSSFLISCRYMDEITKINRNTGEIIWRMGGKNNQFTFINDDLQFSHQTSVQKLLNGNLLVFDSGTLHENQISSIIEYELNETTKTATLINRDAESKNIYVQENGGVQQLVNGNNLVYWGNKSPSLTEYNPNGTVALELDFSSHSSSKTISKSEWKTNSFRPVVDSINFGEWDYTLYTYILIIKNNSNNTITITDVLNFTEHFYIEESLPFQIPANGTKNLFVYYYPEFLETSIVTDLLTLISDSDSQRIAQQVKLVGTRDDFVAPSLTIYPSNGTENVPIDTTLYFIFSEPVRFENNTDISYSNVSNLILFKLNDENGENVLFNAAISTNRDKITIIPENILEYDKTYYLALNGNVEDYYNIALGSDKTSTFNTNLINSISKNDEPEVDIFPNPTSKLISINSNSSPISEVKIFNIHGQLIQGFSYTTTNNVNLNIENISKGIYFLQLKFMNGDSLTRKIVIQ